MYRALLNLLILLMVSSSSYAVRPTAGGGGGGSSLPSGCSDGQIAVYNATTSSWDCGLDNTGPLPSNPAYRVTDSNGVHIGDVLRIDLPFTPTVTADIVVDNQHVVVEITGGYIVNNGPVYFSGSNCSGTAYLLASERVLNIYQAISIIPGASNSQLFYTAVNPGGAPTAAPTVSVRLSTSSSCYALSDNTSPKLEAHTTGYSYSGPLSIELP
jgi:hypothetical protein